MEDERNRQSRASATPDAYGFFSDETEAFRQPAEPGIFEWMTIRLRVDSDTDAQVTLLLNEGAARIPMPRTRTDALFAWHEATVRCGIEPLTYRFLIECADGAFVYQKCGARKADDALPSSFDFRVSPGFSTPAWAQGALLYQIFPDRFANGNAENDVIDGEYSYDNGPVRRIARWDAAPTEDDFRCFYGGDLQGVADKLDYLQSLGVEAIYLNPIFVSPSSHKYDTQDYDHIDPHLAVIARDVQPDPEEEDDDVGVQTRRYIKRTTSRKNLKRSNKLFADLCKEIHRRGMRVILDGVFNHCGSFSRWMDREGIYHSSETTRPGAWQNAGSPYRSYFGFRGDSTTDYEGWWDYPTLPKLNYEHSAELVDRVMGIARTWAMPPYCIDGWRLDVAADLGHSKDFNHAFWRRFRTELKRVNPDLVIIAEHYGDASAWLEGDQWDTVMNYDAFMEPLTYFLTGMEKHSDYRCENLYQNGEAFWETMGTGMARFMGGSLLCAMNELSNHDHSRFLTRTNRMIGRLHTAGSAAAGKGIDMRVMREAVVVQMTWPGAPTIYYADEAGQVGWTDPDCRRTYPWGNEDEDLIELHRVLARLRNAHPALRYGSFAPLGGGNGWIAFGRFLHGAAGGPTTDSAAIVCNNLDREQDVSLRLRTIGVADGSKAKTLLQTTAEGFDASGAKLGRVENGMLALSVPARSAIVLTAKTKKRKGADDA